MDIYCERVAGLDIGAWELKACVRTPSRRRGQRHTEIRSFATTTRGLAQLRAWLTGERVELAVMESTGVYWISVHEALEDHLRRCWVVNATAVKKVPGRKTDVSDARWLAELAEHGLLSPSFVPPRPIRVLRALTRDRARLTQDQSRVAARLHAVLHTASITLAGVASDILGVSGRAMIEALIAGERDPQTLAGLARKRLRNKHDRLVEALDGHFSDLHTTQCRRLLDQFDFLQAQINDLDTQITDRIDADPTLAAARDLLVTIPGVSTRIAEVLCAETGTDMTTFPTPGQLASWAGLCPGNHESAGRHYSGRTRNGNRWARAALGQAAAAAARSHHTYLSARYHRLAARRGKKRALLAVAHTILIAAWHMLTRHQPYTDLGPNWHTHHAGNRTRRATRLTHELKTLGYTATLTDHHQDQPAT
ncbi:MAG: IS110 family transposase [Actinoallomurus sp.]